MIMSWTGMDSRSDEQSSTKPESSGSELKPTTLHQWLTPRRRTARYVWFQAATAKDGFHPMPYRSFVNNRRSSDALPSGNCRIDLPSGSIWGVQEVRAADAVSGIQLTYRALE